MSTFTTSASVAPAGYITDSNGVMAYNPDTNNGFNIKGYFADGWRETTYASEGYMTSLIVDGNRLDINSIAGSLSGVEVEISFEFTNSGKTLKIIYTVKNTDTTTKTISLGSCADVQIGYDDMAIITMFDDNSGFKMVSSISDDQSPEGDYAQFNFFGKGYAGVTDVDTFWYGRYFDSGLYWADREDNQYTQVTSSAFFGDSGCSWGWKDREINANQTQVYSVLIGIGGAGSENVANGSVDYLNEYITGLNPNEQYKIDVSEAGDTATTVILTADSSGRIPLSGTGTAPDGTTPISYNMIGKTTTITPIVEEDVTPVPQVIDVEERPDAPDAPDAPTTAEAPESVVADQVETTTNSIEITAPVIGQEYSIGGTVWQKYTGTETIIFTGLTSNTEYIVSTRFFATAETFASQTADSSPIRTQLMLKNLTINAAPFSGEYDGESHTISVSVSGVDGAVIEYSDTFDGVYTAVKPEYTDVGSHTVYYRVSKEGYYPAYGNASVTIGQGTPTLMIFGSQITYGDTLEDSLLTGTALFKGSDVPGTFAWGDSTIAPSVADSATTYYNVVFTPDDDNIATTIKPIRITVIAASQTQPLSADSVGETMFGESDGKLVGLTDTMEYRVSDGDFISVPAGATEALNLAPGKYQVRYKANANMNASPVIILTIAGSTKIEYNLATIKSLNRSDVEALKDIVTARLNNPNLSQDEEDRIEDVSSQINAILGRIDDIAAAIEAANDGVDAYDIDTVTSDDKTDIEGIIEDIDALLDSDNLTSDERTALEDKKTDAQGLIERIDDIAAAIDAANDGVDAYDIDTVTSDDKADIEGIIEDIDALIGSGNLTTEEIGELQEKRNDAEKVLESFNKVEEVAALINGLPDSEHISLTDKEAVLAAFAGYNDLSENEKAMLGEDLENKIKAYADTIALLEEEANNPPTGDNNNGLLFTILLLSVAALIMFLTKFRREQTID